MPIKNQPLGTVALRPTAAPVATYVHAAEPTPSGAMLLAQSLKDVNPTLQNYLEVEADKQNQETSEEAHKASLLHQVRSYQEAVDKGMLKPGESDLFVRVFEEQRGRVMALEQRNAAFAAYEGWDGKDAAVNGDPDADKKFGQFITGLADDAFKTAPNANVQRGMRPGMEQALTEITAQHGRRTTDLIEQKYQDELGAEIGLRLDSEIAGAEAAVREWAAGDRKTPAPTFDPSKLSQRLNELKNTARAMRVPGQKINEIVVNSVVSAAVRRAQMGDPFAQEYLQVAMQDWTDPATGKAVPGPASTNAGRLALEQAQSRVVGEYQQWERAEEVRAKAAREKAKDQFLATALPQMYRDRRPPTTAELTRIGQLFGPEATKDIMSAVTTGRTIADYDGPGAIGNVYSQLILNPNMSPETAVSLIAGLADPDSKMRVFDDYARLTDLGGGSASAGAQKLRSDPVFGPYVKGMDKLLETNDDPLGISKLFPPSGRDRADQMAGFQSDILDFVASNPQATRADKRKFMRELSSDYEAQVKSLYEQSSGGTQPAPQPQQPAAPTNPFKQIPAR